MMSSGFFFSHVYEIPLIIWDIRIRFKWFLQKKKSINKCEKNEWEMHFEIVYSHDLLILTIIFFACQQFQASFYFHLCSNTYLP